MGSYEATRAKAVGFAIGAFAYVGSGNGGGYFDEKQSFWAYDGGAIPEISIAPKVFLEGAYNASTQLMNDGLRSLGRIPEIEPYTAAGMQSPPAGGEAITAQIVAPTGDNAVCDWVLVELRSAGDATHVVASRSALVQRDGDLVGADGSSALGFHGVAAGNYFVSIRHRNHLGVMTAVAVPLSMVTTSIDLTNPATLTYGTSAQKQVGTKMVMWAGDATGDGTLKYTGSGNDRDPLLIAIGGSTPNAVVTNVYDRRDTNLDGVIKYTGSGNDRDIILTNVGSTTPNSTRTQQLP
jgi:hypothetical protein